MERDLSLNLLLGVGSAIVGMKVAEALEIPTLGPNRDPIAAALRAGELPSPDVQGDPIAIGQRAARAANPAKPGPMSPGGDTAPPS